jgi:hypothetical protein
VKKAQVLLIATMLCSSSLHRVPVQPTVSACFQKCLKQGAGRRQKLRCQAQQSQVDEQPPISTLEQRAGTASLNGGGVTGAKQQAPSYWQGVAQETQDAETLKVVAVEFMAQVRPGMTKSCKSTWRTQSCCRQYLRMHNLM